MHGIGKGGSINLTVFFCINGNSFGKEQLRNGTFHKNAPGIIVKSTKNFRFACFFAENRAKAEGMYGCIENRVVSAIQKSPLKIRRLFESIVNFTKSVLVGYQTKLRAGQYKSGFFAKTVVSATVTVVPYLNRNFVFTFVKTGCNVNGIKISAGRQT